MNTKPDSKSKKSENNPLVRQALRRFMYWFFVSTSLTALAMVLTLVRADWGIGHPPCSASIKDSLTAVMLFVVLLAPSTVILGSFLAVRGSPFYRKDVVSKIIVCMIFVNALFAAGVVANEVRSGCHKIDRHVEETIPGEF